MKDKSNFPRVSVIIPVFNGEKYIREALDSVFSQTYQNYEVIVIDDGSTDRSSEIIHSYSSILYFQQENQGVASARMVGISHAKGELIALLDQDDLWPQEKLSLQVAQFDRDKTCQCVIGKAHYFAEEKIPEKFKKERLTRDMLSYLPGVVMAKKELFQRFGFSSSYLNGSDTDWFFRLKEAKVPITKLDATLLQVRIHSSNNSHKKQLQYGDLLKVLKNSLARKRQIDPLVTVIIPVHNGAAFIVDALESVFSQSYKNIEVIVIDDGSTDKTKEVLTPYLLDDPFLQDSGKPLPKGKVLYFSQIHGGIGSARNRGIKEAKGEYLSFLDADDQWLVDKLERQIAMFKEDREIDFLFGGVEHFFAKPELQEKYRLPPKSLQGFIAGTLMVRKSAAMKVGFFETDYKVGEFIEWCLRARQCNMKMCILKEICLQRRIHGKNTTLTNQGSFRDYLRIIQKYKGLSFELQPV